MANRNGDFSDLVDTSGRTTIIYDPLITGPGPLYLRQPFNYGGKIDNIDPSRISPFMKYVYSVLPEPNILAANGQAVNPQLGNNYYGVAPSIDDQYTCEVVPAARHAVAVVAVGANSVPWISLLPPLVVITTVAWRANLAEVALTST